MYGGHGCAPKAVAIEKKTFDISMRATNGLVSEWLRTYSAMY